MGLQSAMCRVPYRKSLPPGGGVAEPTQREALHGDAWGGIQRIKKHPPTTHTCSVRPLPLILNCPTRFALRDIQGGASARMLFLLLALLLTAFCTLSTALAKSPPPGTGAADIPANILLMLDTSGSMGTVLNESSIYYPVDVDFDDAGNAYVGLYYDTILKYDAGGNLIATFGGYGDDDGEFDTVFSVHYHNGSIYVSDSGNDRVQKLNAATGAHQRTYELLDGPARGVAVDDDGYVYVINSDGEVEKFSNSGSHQGTWNNDGGRYIAIDGEEIWITDFSNRRVEMYDSSGSRQERINLPFRPYGIEVGADGDLYISDYYDGEIYRYEKDGSYVEKWGDWGSDEGEFRYPRGMSLNEVDDTIYVADYYNHRIQSNDGNVILERVEDTRLDVLKRVIRNLMTDSALTGGAHFGMMQWNSDAEMEVEISETGASEIYNTVNSLNDGGSTHLDDAMDLAESYLKDADSPIDPVVYCQQTMLIVLSDGFWEDSTASATAAQLYDELGVRTFVVGFATTGNDNYLTLSQAGGSYPDSPLYASNEENLLDVLKSYIRQVVASQLTFSTPTIIPGVTNEDSILQSTFTYKRNNQWKGRFLKYALLPDGNIGSVLWDAGEVLNNTLANNRNIWTVAQGVDAGLNNFTTAERDRLRPRLEAESGSTYSDYELELLIEFVRGKDAYAEFPSGQDDEGSSLLAGERWKLADIYHSRAVVVGAPSAYSSDSARTETEAAYRYRNDYDAFTVGDTCGGNCDTRDEIVYVGSNAGMLHAFNSDDGTERWAYIPPIMLPKLKNLIALSAGKSESIYGVDGSPAVKDIYVDDTWQTMLMGGLRQGGAGYFALNVTDPNAPQQLFAYSVNHLTQTVSYWDEDGVLTEYPFASVPGNYDLSKLGESWSDPVIVHIPYGSGGRWVAIIGGGYNNAIDASKGAVVYVLDLENHGAVLAEIPLGDSDAGNGIVTSTPARVNVIIPDDAPGMVNPGALAYAADLEGKLWKINFTNAGTMFEATRMFESEATYDNDRMAYHEPRPSLLGDGTLVQFFGTGDMQRVGRMSVDIANRAFAIMDKSFPTATAPASPYVTANLFDAGANPETCPQIDDEGWYIDMDENERITARLNVRNRTLFVPRYTPNSADVCSPGLAKLTEHDYACGAVIRETSLGGGMPTEVTVYKNKIYIGISSDADAAEDLPDGFTKQGNLIVGDPANPSPGSVQIEQWKELY